MKRGATGVCLAAALLSSSLAFTQDTVQQDAIQNVVLRNSFNPVGSGARGLGMGGAFIAVADDGTAASFNPAGLAQLRRSELALVGFRDDLRSTVRRPDFMGGFEATTVKTRHYGKPDFVGVSVPFEIASRHLTVQVSYQRAVDLFGQGRSQTQDSVTAEDVFPTDFLRRLRIPPQQEIDSISAIDAEQNGAFHTAGLAAGYQINARLSVGVAVNYWVAEWTAKGFFSDQYGIPRMRQTPLELFRTDGQFNQKNSLRGLNVNLGLLLNYRWLAIGGVLRLPYTGDYRLEENDSQRSFELGRALEVEPNRFDVSVTGRLHWPRSVGGGVALRPFRGLTVAGDYARSHWSRAFIEDLPGGALRTPLQYDSFFDPLTGANIYFPVSSFMDRNFFDLLPASQTSTKDTDQWRGGGEYLVSLPKIVIPLRGGVFRDRSPIAEPGTDEGRRIEGVTLGTGLNFSRIVLDVAFERRKTSGVIARRFERFTGGQQVPSRNVPTETVREDRIVAAVIYRFGGQNDPLKRLLRFLFVGSQEGKDN